VSQGSCSLAVPLAPTGRSHAATLRRQSDRRRPFGCADFFQPLCDSIMDDMDRRRLAGTVPAPVAQARPCCASLAPPRLPSCRKRLRLQCHTLPATSMQWLVPATKEYRELLHAWWAWCVAPPGFPAGLQWALHITETPWPLCSRGRTSLGPSSQAGPSSRPSAGPAAHQVRHQGATEVWGLVLWGLI